MLVVVRGFVEVSVVPKSTESQLAAVADWRVAYLFPRTYWIEAKQGVQKTLQNIAGRLFFRLGNREPVASDQAVKSCERRPCFDFIKRLQDRMQEVLRDSKTRDRGLVYGATKERRSGRQRAGTMCDYVWRQMLR